MTTQSPSKTSSVDFNTPAMQRHRAMRHFKDHFTRWYVAVGGLGVIVAVLLIFLYLLYEVLPLFGGAEIEERERYSASWVQADDPPLMRAAPEISAHTAADAGDGRAGRGGDSRGPERPGELFQCP